MFLQNEEASSMGEFSRSFSENVRNWKPDLFFYCEYHSVNIHLLVVLIVSIYSFVSYFYFVSFHISHNYYIWLSVGVGNEIINMFNNFLKLKEFLVIRVI